MRAQDAAAPGAVEVMRRFKLADKTIGGAAPDLQTALADAYRNGIRPFCLCKEGGLPMYIARVGDQYIVKRMPLSGGGHDPACPSYEPPDELSGLGVLMGSAIQIDPQSGMSALKVGFSLTKRRPGRTRRGNGRIRHCNWRDEEDLAAWTPALSLASGRADSMDFAMGGKASLVEYSLALEEAAGQHDAEGRQTLSEILVPEPFRATDKGAIEQRRTAELAPAIPPKSGPRKLMILVGEVKDFVPARSGHRLIVKHLPDFPLCWKDGLYRRLKLASRTNWRFGSG
jgi:hypothetical protein